ncbi:MAG TPA: hypothetical protein VHM88_14645, partial [Candidatus Acidoferrales bacterium]|nr:hypothetical protein [Candidatus Acidoferrales bacterium]
VWGVTPPPHDWIRFPGSLAAAAQPALALAPAPEPPMIPPSTEKTRILPTPSKAEASETTSRGSAAPGSRASTSPPGPTKPTRVVVSGEQLLRALEGKLQQVAENAVTSAVTKAVQTIENACRASLHQIEERWVQHRERLVASAREELLGQLRAELARAGEQQNQFAARLHETADRVAAEFTDETVRLSDRQLARLGEKVQAATGEAAAQLEAQAAEACSQLETAAGTALAGFHVQASVEIELAVTKARKNVESSLASFVAEKRADWQARQRAWHDELARVSKQETEQFRRHLETILNSWMSAAVSAVNEQSKALLDSLAKRTAQQLREPSRG